MFNLSTFNPWNYADPGNRFFDSTAFSDTVEPGGRNDPRRTANRYLKRIR